MGPEHILGAILLIIIFVLILIKKVSYKVFKSNKIDIALKILMRKIIIIVDQYDIFLYFGVGIISIVIGMILYPMYAKMVLWIIGAIILIIALLLVLSGIIIIQGKIRKYFSDDKY